MPSQAPRFEPPQESVERRAAIEQAPFDPGDSPISFEDKLVENTGWTRVYAQGAVREYRRFLVLSTLTKHVISPSAPVDGVWHLHVLFTRNYAAFCDGVLGHFLHHDPATGSAENRESLDDAYEQTLASYRTIFGEEPPVAYWPPAPAPGRFKRIDTHQTIALPRSLWRGLWIAVVLLFVALLVIEVWKGARP